MTGEWTASAALWGGASRASRLDAPPSCCMGGEESRPYNHIIISRKPRPVGGEFFHFKTRHHAARQFDVNTMKNLELIILIILVSWVSLSYVIAYIGGWFTLARFYRLSGTFLGERWRFQSAQLRWKIGYNNCVTVGASPVGLYLSVMFILRFGHPSLFVPWSDISVKVIKGFFTPVLEFRFQQAPAIPLRVSERLSQKIRALAGTSWPAGSSEGVKLGSNDQGRREANSLT